jgi:cysteinyl-tRNA synthetase, unknown class
MSIGVSRWARAAILVGWGVGAVVGATVCMQPVMGREAASAEQRAKVAMAEKRAATMAKVKSWGYQLQRLDPPAIAASPFDLVVIDHAPDRVESVEMLFRRAELDALKTKPDGTRRLVLAYLSIGEAENYRFYWDNAWFDDLRRPAWLGEVNPQWVGNYPVEFWRPGWQQLIYGRSDSYLDRVLDAGFDGIYLDRADVYDQFKDRPQAKEEMAAFVSGLIDHARSIKPDTLVVLQNAEELVRRKDIRSRIDGVAKESLFFNPDLIAAASASDVTAALGDLRLARKAGRKILLVEYLGDPVRAKQARTRAEAEGFVIHFAERSLSSLNVRAPDQ